MRLRPKNLSELVVLLAPTDGAGELGRLGSFPILDFLGDGGMGFVCLTRTPDGREAALKVLKPDLVSNDTFQKRFLREAEVAKSIYHDHVVKVLDAGEVSLHHNGAESPAPYLLMERLHGQPLDRQLAAGPLPWPAMVWIARDTLLGLAAIHSSGFTHRDIKPQNLWLEELSARVKVLDFGLARAVDHTHFTAAGHIVGTPAYMSPEQVRCEEADRRSDLFSLGTVLYHASTGRRPFNGSSTEEILRGIRDENPPPPSQVNPLVPPVLDHFVMWFLQKDRERRYRSAEVALAALDRAVAALRGEGAGLPSPDACSPKEGITFDGIPELTLRIPRFHYRAAIPPPSPLSPLQSADAPHQLPEGHPAWCFLRRDHATPDMQREMKKYTRLVFWGISHQNLATHFHEIVDSLPANETLPWESVVVYYARDDIGRVFDGSETDFHSHVRRSRKKIADVLVNQFHRIPNLREVVFKQSTDGRSQTGCMFGYGSDADADFRVIYLISALPPRKPDNSPTFKLSAEGGASLKRLQPSESLGAMLGDVFRAVQGESLGIFGRTLWDQSAKEWAEFSQSSVQQEGMRKLVQHACIGPGDRVLELAAGSGHLSCIIRDRLQEVGADRLTVLEGSPAMLRASKEVLGDSVRYALCQLPKMEGREDIDILGKKFTVIVMHLSVAAVANGLEVLNQLARWCAGHLKPGGRVILSAHNTVVTLDTSPPFVRAQDPLRQKLREAAARMNVRHLLREQRQRISPNDIEVAFTGNSFSKEEPEREAFSITGAERCALWRAPAILDSFIDVQKIGIKRAHQLLDTAFQSPPADIPPASRTVGYWEFIYNPRKG